MYYKNNSNFYYAGLKLLLFLKNLNIKIIFSKKLKDYGVYEELKHKNGKITREVYIKDDLDTKEHAFTLLHETAHVLSFMLKFPHYLKAEEAIIKQGEKKRLSQREKNLIIEFEEKELEVWKFINKILQLNIKEKDLIEQHAKDMISIRKAYGNNKGAKNNAKKERKK